MLEQSGYVARGVLDEGPLDRRRLAFALEATGTGLWSLDRTSGLVSFDDSLRELTGHDEPGAVPLARFLQAFPESDIERFRALLDHAEEPAAAEGTEFRLLRLTDGRESWVMVRTRHDPATGQVLGTARDVTQLKRHDLHVHMLMREVTHRSKNLLAIIQAMARQTVKDSLSAADFEARFSARLRGLSFSHELLASQDWRGASLSELAAGHLKPLLERHPTRIEISGPVVFVRPEAAQNIGLALNELGSNAQQFGALSGSQGTVQVTWHIDVDEAGPKALHLLWTEAGASTTLQPPSRQGFGHKVMERVVARALDAVVSMSFAPTGLRWSLKMPLSHIASDQVG